MFGYVVMNKPEMRFREYDEYRMYYCGLCRELKGKYGISGQISLTYDMTFVLMLLDALYEFPVQKDSSRCAVHPVRRHPIIKSQATGYAADMNLLLAYYKCMDDWTDEKKADRLLYARLIRSGQKKVEVQYPEKAARIEQCLADLSRLEADRERDLDRVSACTGDMLAEVMAYRQDMWEESLRKMGFYLGKFIYIMDAYEDVEKDLANGNYNPFSDAYIMSEFEESVRGILVMMMTEVCREFEKLPILRNAQILRNILYSGVWCRYATITEKRKNRQENEKNGSI
jgi:hypothetical protein